LSIILIVNWKLLGAAYSLLIINIYYYIAALVLSNYLARRYQYGVSQNILNKSMLK
jgi:hypothetical protein